MVTQDSAFWKKKKVLVTGHTGFKGTWMTLLLERLGVEVVGVSKDQHNGASFYDQTGIEKRITSNMIDLRDQKQCDELFASVRPDIVFHFAAQALVPYGYDSPYDTFTANFICSLNVLEAVRKFPSCKVAVMVTTDKVYENLGDSKAFVETDRLGGNDPYSASKSATELLIASYRRSFLEAMGVSVVSVRAGNVIGGGDFTPSRLLPDIYRSWCLRQPMILRNPTATRPWQHVLEPISGYLRLAEKAYENLQLSGGYNFGPAKDSSISVSRIVELATDLLGPIDYTVEDSISSIKEAGQLQLDSNKALRLLDFEAQWNVEKSVEKALIWYQRFAAGENAECLCADDIVSYGYA